MAVHHVFMYMYTCIIIIILFYLFFFFIFFSHHQLHVAMYYQACQRTYQESVGVFGSHIHRLGLFCLQEIDSGDMVIEYTGTVIRSTLGEVL